MIPNILNVTNNKTIALVHDRNRTLKVCDSFGLVLASYPNVAEFRRIYLPEGVMRYLFIADNKLYYGENTKVVYLADGIAGFNLPPPDVDLNLSNLRL